jgi:hypothetical protein
MVERYRPQKNIMHRFQIAELSAVDKPAQTPAQMTIIKRKDGIKISLMGKDQEGDGSSRKIPLTRDQIGAASVPLRHDDDPDANKLLKLEGVTALTFNEAQHMAKLAGQDRRTFLLADHAARKEMMPAQPEDSEDEDEEMNDFQQAVDKFAADGTPRRVAMQKARRAYPDLFAKYQEQPVSADVAKAARAEADAVAKNVAHRHELDAAITEHMMTKKVTRLDALRSLRRERPEMFEEAAA